MSIKKNWRDIKAGKEILKFNADADNQILVAKFLSEGVIKEFSTPKYNNAGVQIGSGLGSSVEFEVEYKDKNIMFSTGSNRLITALQKVSENLIGKRIKMSKVGTGMDTEYSAELMK